MPNRLAYLSIAVVVLLAACSTTPKEKPTQPAEPSKIVLPIDSTVSAADAGIVSQDNGVTVVRLSQKPCRFVEAEPSASFDEHQSYAACKAHNAKTLSTRKQRALRIPAGKVRFVVSSQDVPYTLGFWIRDVRTPQKAIAQGGGIEAGKPKTYEVDLKPGTYLYACPLNPTPDYTIIVE